MTPKRIPILTVEGVPTASATAGTASFKLPIGKMIHACYVDVTVANSSAPPSLSDAATTIRVKRNGKTIREMLATELDALNSLDAEQLRSTVDGITGQVLGQIAAPAVGGTYTGTWAVGDLVTFTGGTLANIPGASKAVFAVATVSSNLPTAFRVVNPGQYSVAPSSTTPVILKSASGTVGTGTITPALVVLTGLAYDSYVSETANQAQGMIPMFGSPIPFTGDTATFRIPILFADPSRSSLAATNAFALPTKWGRPAIADGTLKTNGDGSQELNSLTVEIVIPGNANTSGYVVKPYVEVTDNLGALIDKNGLIAFGTDDGLGYVVPAGFDSASSRPFQKLVKWYRSPVGYTGTGEFEYDLPRSGAYQQIALFAQAGDPITQVRVLVNGTEYVGALSKAQVDETHFKRGMNPLAIDPFRFDLVFDYTDNPNDALVADGLQSFKILPTLGNASASTKSITMIRKVYGDPD